MHPRLADDVARLPEVCETSDLSTAALLRILGFPERRLLLEAVEVCEALRQSSHLVPKWMARANDQQLMGGWGIEKDGDQYRVQRFGRQQTARLFVEQVEAVAEFAVRYVQFVCDALSVGSADAVRTKRV